MSGQIDWNNRYLGDKGRTCLTSVDGVDMMIPEPGNPTGRVWYHKKTGKRLTCNPKWYSHKFEGPGVRYEVAVCLQTGDIVWIHGPFPCGKWPDNKIFQLRLQGMLDEYEMVEADRNYRGMPYHCRTPYDYLNASDKRAKKNARARQETINRRLKQFQILGQRFRHELSKHKMCFQAVAVCVQLSFDYGHPPFQIRY